MEELPLATARRTRTRSRAALGDDVSAVILAGRTSSAPWRTSRRWSRRPRRAGALVVVQCDPLPLGILRPPGDFGVDVAVGEGQTLGNRLDFGGPSFGFFAAQEAYLRRMPGRIAGETTDVDGRRGFVLTLQTREQHIRREKATHNICTTQALNALAGDDLPELARAARAWSSSASCCSSGRPTRAPSSRPSRRRLLHEQPVVREFAVRLDADVDAVIERCAAQGVNPGYPLARDYPELGDGLLVAVTEQRSRADIDRLACRRSGRGAGAVHA